MLMDEDNRKIYERRGAIKPTPIKTMPISNCYICSNETIMICEKCNKNICDQCKTSKICIYCRRLEVKTKYKKKFCCF